MPSFLCSAPIARMTVRARCTSLPTWTSCVPPGSSASLTDVAWSVMKRAPKSSACARILFISSGPSMPPPGKPGEFSTSVVCCSRPPHMKASITSGLRFARAVYSAAVYPAGPLPMMITFSTSAMLWVLPGSSRFSLYSTDSRTPVTPGCPLGLPPRHRAPQLEVGHRARDRRQVEREQPVGQHGHDDRVLRLAAEGDERADHPTIDAAHAAGQRRQGE